jgi:hypothetical protein
MSSSHLRQSHLAQLTIAPHRDGQILQRKSIRNLWRGTATALLTLFADNPEASNEK